MFSFKSFSVLMLGVTLIHFPFLQPKGNQSKQKFFQGKLTRARGIQEEAPTQKGGREDENLNPKEEVKVWSGQKVNESVHMN